MEEATPTSTWGDNPIGEHFRPENLQNLKAKKIQALIISLQSLIPTGAAPTDPAPYQEQAAITQEYKDHATLPTLTDVNVDDWRRLAEGGELVPPPPLPPTAIAPQQGPAAASPQTSRGPLSTLKELCAAQPRSHALAAYPRIVDLLNTDTTLEAKDRLKNSASLALKERPSLITVVAGPPRHDRVL